MGGGNRAGLYRRIGGAVSTSASQGGGESTDDGLPMFSFQSLLRDPAADTSTPVGLHNRGRITVMTYAVARLGAVTGMPVDNYDL